MLVLRRMARDDAIKKTDCLDHLESGEFKSVGQAARAERSAHYGVTDSAVMSI